MKLGFVTEYKEERVKCAAQAGFDCLEVVVNPGGALDLPSMTKDQIENAAGVFKENKIAVGMLHCTVNHLDPDKEKRAWNNKFMIKTMETAKQLGVEVISCNTWGDRSKTLQDNLPVYKEVFKEYAKAADANNVKIAMENCPHMGSYPITIGNIGMSPATWKALFDAVPSKAIGLEYDPSHLFWLGVDYIKAVYEFGDRIFCVHAKDTEIMRDVYSRTGIYGEGWWRYRIPGWGEIDWKAFMKALNDVGFNGNMAIEHEDPVFGGERTDEGLRLGLKFLRQFIG